MLMMRSQILKSVDFTKKRKPKNLESETLFFLQIKKFINYTSRYFIAKNSFAVDVTFKALETIQTSFLWNNSNPKIKHKTLCKRYENGGLKNVDIRNKVNSLQSSWVKRLYNDCFHEWKIIRLNPLKKSFWSFL